MDVHVTSLLVTQRDALLACLLSFCVLAVASCVILYRYRRWPVSPPSSNGHALLVIAHPDDEAMFFAPTLAALREAGWRVCIMCLSTGTCVCGGRGGRGGGVL